MAALPVAGSSPPEARGLQDPLMLSNIIFLAIPRRRPAGLEPISKRMLSTLIGIVAMKMMDNACYSVTKLLYS